MAATTKAELMALSDREYAKLIALFDRPTEAQALEKDDEETSIKDVIAHRAHWIGLFLGWYRGGLAGKKAHFPAPGCKWNELKRYNAELRVQQGGIGWLHRRK